MAKLIKSVGTSLRPKTYDEQDDIMMKGRGASSIFRNMAFQDEDQPVASSRTLNSQESLKKNNFFGGVSDTAAGSVDVTPRAKDAGAGAAVWSHQPDIPSTAKRAGSTASAGSPPVSRGSASFRPNTSAKRSKAASTTVTAISAYEHEVQVMDEVSGGSEDGTGQHMIAVRHVQRGPSISSSTSHSVKSWEEEVRRLIACGRAEDALRSPAPSDGLIRCTVRRTKNFLGQTLAYQLYLDNGDVFLLAARKRKKSKASNFVLSTSQDDLAKDSDHCVAKLRANFVGTEYSLASRTGHYAASPSSDDHSSGSGSGKLAPPAEPFSREELAVHYKQTALKAKAGPRVMLVATPLPELPWSPCAADGSDQLAACLESARKRELAPRLERQLCMLATRPPEWDANLKAYTLDFHGRVRASSVKNFQLVHWDHNTDRKGSDLVLQFGKVEEGNEDFALDFTYPLSIQKAFAIALASIDSKLCYAL